MKIIERISRWIKLGKEIEKGLYVQPESRDTFIATLHGRKMRIYIELLPGKSNIIVYRGKGKKWLPPDDHELISDEQNKFIINALVKHLRKVGYSVEIR